ncbi:MAG: phosphate-starvation-inducible PsiE family protein [Xenococcaceae cyanobacterium MO_167.B52]|nr:phosphate-starvation-inducible PsiE family protein [Xenococcaceae cyanobacterium MO_167.B52]
MSSVRKAETLNRRFSLDRLFRNLDALQDIVVFMCGALLVFKMMLILGDIFLDIRAGLEFKTIAANSLFLLILVELFRLLAVYLKYHRIYVSIAVEVTIVSILREVILIGLVHIDYQLVWAMCGFLFALGVLMLISHKIDGEVEH